jgi:hypothetical protein
MRILADGDAKELMRLRDQLASLDADAARCAAPSEKTDWSALYSGVKATDARMETERLACDKCGGLQEQCTCPAEYEDAAPPIPPAAPVDLRHGVNCVKEPTIANVFTKGSTVISRKTMKMTAGTLGVLLLIIPPAAMALDWNIFSVIESTISSDIGGALTALNGIQSAMRQDQQALLFPVSLINQSHNYITTITTSYRGWMSGVFTLPVNSAQLTSSQSLERVFLGGSTSSIGSMNGLYNTSFGVLPTATAAPQPHRHMMDMDDALAKDALAQSIAADQATTSLVQIANQIESESATTAPGTAAMLSATARAAELQSLASQHKLLASMLREEGANLAHHNGLRKQSVQQMQQMNTNMRGTIAQQQGEE